MIVELKGLRVFGYHGVEEDEQRLGQLFLYDVELEVGDRGASDRLEDAVDYAQVAATIRETTRTVNDLSRLAENLSALVSSFKV